MSSKELMHLAHSIGSYSILGGSSCSSPASRFFDEVSEKDIAAAIFDILSYKERKERYRTLDEWNRWMVLGASIVKQHQDHPRPLVAEIETYRDATATPRDALLHQTSEGKTPYAQTRGHPSGSGGIEAQRHRQCTRRRPNVHRILRIGRMSMPRPNPDAVRKLFFWALGSQFE